jgi:hypothetical protein
MTFLVASTFLFVIPGGNLRLNVRTTNHSDSSPRIARARLQPCQEQHRSRTLQGGSIMRIPVEKPSHDGAKAQFMAAYHALEGEFAHASSIITARDVGINLEPQHKQLPNRATNR